MTNQQLVTEVAEVIMIEHSAHLSGTVPVAGAKNAVLVIMLSLLLAKGKSVLKNVPDLSDVRHMISLLEDLGATVTFDAEQKVLTVDTTNFSGYTVRQQTMQKMRASILVLGPLLVRQQRAEIALPGGCVLGLRQLDYHFENFRRLGAIVTQDQQQLLAIVPASGLQAQRLALDYPSVGATENLLMAATLTPGTTEIVNAALEPEVLDLIQVLQLMGADIAIELPATIKINGVAALRPVVYTIMPDRLEAGCLLLAAAATGGELFLPNISPNLLDIVLFKLLEMGHTIQAERGQPGIWLKAARNPKAVSFKTAPYPGFPTDLQAPMLAAQCTAFGVSQIEETVYENRLTHVRELIKMGAQIQFTNTKATITGVDDLYGTEVVASDIRASFALILAGLIAQGRTIMHGITHFRRGYDGMERKLQTLGAKITISNLAELNPALKPSGLSAERL